jgi:hypothetical protein
VDPSVYDMPGRTLPHTVPADPPDLREV